MLHLNPTRVVCSDDPYNDPYDRRTDAQIREEELYYEKKRHEDFKTRHHRVRTQALVQTLMLLEQMENECDDYEADDHAERFEAISKAKVNLEYFIENLGAEL